MKMGAMKIDKMLIAGVAAAAFNMAFGVVMNRDIFRWVYQLEPTEVWKPMSSGPNFTFMAGLLVLGVIFSFVYALIQKGIPGSNKLVKGIVFGLCVWAAGRLAGMFMIHSFITVPTPVVVYWTILGAVKLPLEGMIVAALYGE